MHFVFLRYILANSNLFFFMFLCQQWGLTIASLFMQIAMYSLSRHICALCLKVSLNFSRSWLRFFILLANNPSLQSLIIYSLLSTSREISYSAMGCKLLDNVAHRNIKISGDGLVTLRFSKLFHNFCSQILRQFFAALSLLHAPYGTQRHTTEWLSQFFTILTGYWCDFYIVRPC